MVPRNPGTSMVFWNSKRRGFEKSEQNPGEKQIGKKGTDLERSADELMAVGDSPNEVI